MVNLDKYNQILSVDKNKKIIVMQAGIRLVDLCSKLRGLGWSMPNLGSINEQSIAGAISTATHGSSTRHGILSQSVRGLKIMLSNGRTVSCSAEQNQDLFRAALVSLGALGIITEVTFQAVSAFNIEWHQSLAPLQDILDDWPNELWSHSEYTRVWWMPYMKKVVLWRANTTDKPIQQRKVSRWRDALGFHTYHILLWAAHYFPVLLPAIERYVIYVQYGKTEGEGSFGVEDGQKGLLMNCLYSQLVNEWAIPLSKGPEAISRLSAWLNGDQQTARIPFDSKGLYVHGPIEVRVCDSSTTTPRPYLDNTVPDGPTLYLNATLYRPYNLDPPCTDRYYEAFEWLMKQMGGRPHWAKNFHTVTKEDVRRMYPDLPAYLRTRSEVDPEGMFIGDWHRTYLLSDEESRSLPLEEKETRREYNNGNGTQWFGELTGKPLSPQISEDSFDLMHGVEAEKSVVLPDWAAEEEHQS